MLFYLQRFNREKFNYSPASIKRNGNFERKISIRYLMHEKPRYQQCGKDETGIKSNDCDHKYQPKSLIIMDFCPDLKIIDNGQLEIIILIGSRDSMVKIYGFLSCFSSCGCSVPASSWC